MTPALPDKLYHFAAQISDLGQVSALCFKKPRAIDLKQASWTNRPKAVTCPKCKRMLAERGGNPQKSDE